MNADDFSNFRWRKIRYTEIQHHKVQFVTYECRLCYTTIEDTPDRIPEALAAHTLHCEHAPEATHAS